MKNKKLPPPWMMGSQEIHGVPMIIAHFQNGELEGLDNLQGGPSIDPDTGIREYSALSEIIELPEVRKIFHTVADQIDEHGDISPELHHDYEKAKEYTVPYQETAQEEHDPIRHLERQGRNGDTKLAFIPLNLAHFLIELRHVPSINPKTGLLEFFNIGKGVKKAGKLAKKALRSKLGKNIIRTGATLAGAYFGGPSGAGIANAVAHKLTSKKSLIDSAMSGLKTGAMGYGVQGLGQAAGLSKMTPGTGNMFGSGFMGQDHGPNYLAQGLGKMGIGHHQNDISGMPWLNQFQSGNNGSGWQSETSGMPWNNSDNSQGGNNQSGGGQGGVGSQPSGMMNTLDIMSKLMPVVSGALAYKGEKQHHKHEKKEAEAARADLLRQRQLAGLDAEWEPRLYKKKWKRNPAFYNASAEDLKYGRIHEPAYLEEDEENGFAKGGHVRSATKATLIKGKGTGQSDQIKTSVPDGSYIIDASTTSNLGDGSSEAGGKVLSKFAETIVRKTPKKALRVVKSTISKNTSQVPVWLSNDEFKFSPLEVTLLGKGSNKKGAAMLRHMVQESRKHKISRGTELPPKSKLPHQYMGGRI